MDDLKRKIRYWLPRADERQRIAGAGMQRAHQEHTYRHRLALLLATLEGKAGGFPLPALHEHC
jgi:spore maturation protein CgeB